jgi:alpha-ribazole phosphatase
VTGFALHLLRHGEAEGAGRLIGRRDAPPLPAGIAACIARARDLAVARIVSSDLARALHPARAIAARHDLPHRIDPRWRELDFGQWEGREPATLPDADLGAFWADPEASPPPGGERWSALRTRIGTALDGIAEPTLVVTHAGAIRAALSCLLGLDHRQGWAMALPHAALVSLHIRPGEKRTAQMTGLVTGAAA